MPQVLSPNPWLVNTLLDEAFVAGKRRELGKLPLPYDLSQWLDEHFDAVVLCKRSEAQLEEKFIGPLLKQLGWITVSQQNITVQGPNQTGVFCLSPAATTRLSIAKTIP